MKTHKCTDWNIWSRYKKMHPKSVNSELGMMIQNDYNSFIKQVMPIDGEISSEVEMNEQLIAILEETKYCILDIGLGYTAEKKEQYKNLINSIIENNLDENSKKQLQDKFCENVDKWINNQVGGNYVEIKDLYKKLSKPSEDKEYIRKRAKEDIGDKYTLNEESTDDDDNDEDEA